VPFRKLGYTRARLEAALAACIGEYPTLRWRELPQHPMMVELLQGHTVVATITLENGWLEYQVVDRHHPLNGTPVSFENPAPDPERQAQFAKNPTRPVIPHRPYLKFFF
jgi:hypothetical protein